MAITEPLNHRAWREYMATRCSVCSAPKQARHSFCRNCYFALPGDMRKALYRRFGSGYEEAHDDARQYLEGERRATQ